MQIAKARSTEFKRLFDDVGEPRFKRGVEAAIRGYAGGFFPTIADFLPYVPTSANADHVTCPKCDGSQAGGAEGFVIVKKMVNGKFIDAAARCTHGGE
jgi:hypothetical protein